MPQNNSSSMTPDNHCCMGTQLMEETPPISSAGASHTSSTYPLRSYWPSLSIQLSTDDKMCWRPTLCSIPQIAPSKTWKWHLHPYPKTIFFGTPCNLTISLMNTCATSLAEYVVFTGIKWDTLLNLSTTTIIESCYFTILERLVMKPMEITSHFHSGIAIGCNKPPRCLHSVLTCWQSKHIASSHDLYIELQWAQEAYLEGISCQAILGSSRISKDIDIGKEVLLLA